MASCECNDKQKKKKKKEITVLFISLKCTLNWVWAIWMSKATGIHEVFCVYFTLQWNLQKQSEISETQGLRLSRVNSKDNSPGSLGGGF